MFLGEGPEGGGIARKDWGMEGPLPRFKKNSPFLINSRVELKPRARDGRPGTRGVQGRFYTEKGTESLGVAARREENLQLFICFGEGVIIFGG